MPNSPIISPLVKFKQELNTAQSKKDELDKLLEIYSVKYDLGIRLVKGPHDIIDVEHKLNIYFKNRKDLCRLRFYCI